MTRATLGLQPGSPRCHEQGQQLTLGTWLLVFIGGRSLCWVSQPSWVHRNILVYYTMAWAGWMKIVLLLMELESLGLGTVVLWGDWPSGARGGGAHIIHLAHYKFWRVGGELLFEEIGRTPTSTQGLTSLCTSESPRRAPSCNLRHSITADTPGWFCENQVKIYFPFLHGLEKKQMLDQLNQKRTITWSVFQGSPFKHLLSSNK